MNSSARILVVDDDPAICGMICRTLEKEGHEMASETLAEKGLKRLQEEHFDVLLSDVQMPGMDGLELTRRALEQEPDLQVVLVTGNREPDTAIQALRVGAADYLAKPFRVDELRFVVRRAVEKRRLLLEREAYRERLEQEVQDRTGELSERNREVESLYEQLQDSYEQTLQSLAAALGSRDHETRGHSGRVVAYACLLGEELGLDEERLRELRWGSILHDIGKIAVPDAVLRKPSSLTKHEESLIRPHPQLGYEMLKHVSFLEPALKIVLHHHEWWDGSGYPDGLRGEEIPYSARIFGVVDAFDAMTSDRPYRKALSAQEARDQLLAFRGRQFEPEIVDTFLRIGQEGLEETRRQVEKSLADH